MKRLLTVFLFVFVINILAVRAASPDLEMLRKRVIAELMQPQVDDARVKQLIATIQANGTWPGIDYKDVSRTGFQHGDHLVNLVTLSRAYKKQGSRFKGNRQLKKVIYSALDYWLQNDFICDNWWWNQIGTPAQFVQVLLIMDDDLTADEVARSLTIAGRANLKASGARPSGDRIKIAGIYAKNALFQRNDSLFNYVIKVIEGEIKYANGPGLQHDLSFQHRPDKVISTLSYGTDYADAFAEWAAFVAGTKYAFSENALKLLTDYYLDGICGTLVYGRYPDPGAKNRGITRVGALHQYGTVTPERLLKASSYRKDEKYAAKAALLLKTWFADPATRMNPNLNYSQGIPGICDGRGIGIIDFSRIDKAITALQILEANGKIDDSTDREIRAWFDQYLTWLLTSEYGKDEEDERNNHATWYDVQAAGIALYLDRQQIAAARLEDVKTKRIATQIEPDGKQPYEIARTRSLSYSSMNLRGFLNLALLGKTAGVDIWNYETPDGRSIPKALEYLLPYATGKTKWEESQITSMDEAIVGLRPDYLIAAYLSKDEKYRLSLPGKADDLEILLFPGLDD